MSSIYALKQNDLYSFVIATKASAENPWSIEGKMQNEIAFGGSNDYKTAKEILSDVPIVGAAIDIKDKFSAALNLVGRSDLTDFETTKVWNGSGTPQFTLDVTFINDFTMDSNNEKSALYKMKLLQSTVLPSKGAPASAGRQGSFFRAPLGYKLNGEGTLTLQIGRWFRASNLVMVSTNLVPSKQVMPNGAPLMVTGTITLEPYQAITYEEFQSWIRI